MANYIHIDSSYRDKEEYPNENNFQLTAKQVQGWNKYARSVRPFPQNPSLQPLDFASSLKIVSIITPYSEFIAQQPYLFLCFGNIQSGVGYSDISLVSTINNHHNDIRFVLFQRKIQKDDSGQKIWIHWTSEMEQVTRFRRDVEMIMTLKTRFGVVLPSLDTDPYQTDISKQVSCTVEITPYLRDASYDNHYTQPLTQ